MLQCWLWRWRKGLWELEGVTKQPLPRASRGRTATPGTHTQGPEPSGNKQGLFSTTELVGQRQKMRDGGDTKDSIQHTMQGRLSPNLRSTDPTYRVRGVREPVQVRGDSLRCF